MIVYPDEVFYQKVRPADVPKLVEEHFLKGRIYEPLLVKSPETDNLIATQREFAFFNKQFKIVLENCGIIDPEKIGRVCGPRRLPGARHGPHGALSPVGDRGGQEERPAREGGAALSPPDQVGADGQVAR